jgi:hypothetical protein
MSDAAGLLLADQPGTDEAQTEQAGPSQGDRGLWSPLTGAFRGPRLRRAIVSRGWTAQEFAVAAGLTSASIYSALRGHKVRDRTALKIFRALAHREPIRFQEL